MVNALSFKKKKIVFIFFDHTSLLCRHVIREHAGPTNFRLYLIISKITGKTYCVEKFGEFRNIVPPACTCHLKNYKNKVKLLLIILTMINSTELLIRVLTRRAIGLLE